MSVESESDLAILRRVTVSETRILVLMGPATQSPLYAGCVERPTTTFELKVGTSHEDKAAFDAAVRKVPCLSNLTFEPWRVGDAMIRRFEDGTVHEQAVEEARALALAYS